MKQIRTILLLLMCIFLLAGCTKENRVSEEKETLNPTATQAPEVTESIEPSVTLAMEQDNTDTAEKLEINIAVMTGPTGIGMVKVMEASEAGSKANNYNISVVGTPDEISTGLIQGKLDIAAVPCNLASVLYNKTEGKIKLAGINTLGVLYIVETGDSIQSVEDLKGKTIYSTGFGTTPQYTLNYLLSSYGIDPEKDVTIEYKTEATEVAAILSQSENAIAMLPQPFVTTVMMNNDHVRIALDVSEEWEKVSKDQSSVVTGVVVVRNEFLDNHKAAVDAFLEEYQTSTTFVNENVNEAANLVEKFNIFKAAVAKKAIPDCNITLIRGEEMKEKVSGYLNVLYNQNPKAVGGQLPADDFYYMP